MNNLLFKKLGELCTFENGDRGQNYPSEQDFLCDGIPFISGSAIDDGKIVKEQLRYISEEKYDSLRAGKAKKGDLLFSLRGSLNKIVICPFSKSAIASALVIIRPKDNVSTDFLYYLFKSQYFQTLCLNYDNGSIQANLSVNVIKDFNIPVFEEFNTSCSILKAIDKKIENNNEINEELESLAKSIYDYWFLQFEFPNEEGKPYKSSGGKMVWNEELKREIPEGWKISKLQNLVSVLKDGTHNPPKRIETGIPLLTGQMFGDTFVDYSNATYISESEYKSIHSQYQPEKDDIVITKIGTLGNVNYLTEDDLPLAIHCNSALLRFKDDFKGPYSFYLLNSIEFQNRFKRAKGQSVQEFVSLSKMADISILIPNIEIVKAFNTKLFKTFRQKEIIRKENSELSSLRDFLLPMLMNGQVGFIENG